MKHRIAVFGGGAGGQACSADLTHRGYVVNLFELPEFKSPHIDAISERGGIKTNGLFEEIVKLNLVTTDMKEAIKNCSIILIVVPAFGLKAMCDAYVPYLEKNHTVIFAGRCGGGTLTLSRSMKEFGIKTNITMGETHNMPLAARLTAPGEIYIGGWNYNLLAAAFPGKDNEKIIEPLRELFPSNNTIPAESVLETILNVSLNHPLIVIFNLVRMEQGKEFRFYVEGLSPTAKRVAGVVQREVMTVMQALGINPRTSTWPDPPDKEAYAKRMNAFLDWFKAPNTPQVRFMTEDIPYAWVTIASLGDLAGVQTPTIDAVITLGSLINQVDYWRTGRTTKDLGISELSVDELKRFVIEGKL